MLAIGINEEPLDPDFEIALAKVADGGMPEVRDIGDSGVSRKTDDVEMKGDELRSPPRQPSEEEKKCEEIEMRPPPVYDLFAETLSTQNELFREDQLAKIANGEDAHIDDPDLMAKRQALGK